MHSPLPGIPMKAPPYLDDDQIERLAQLLEQRAVPFKGFNLEALDGYLSALVVTPDTVPPEEWQPPVWGTPPRWADEAERLEIETLLQGHWNMAAQRVRHGEDDLPDHLAPLLWLPEDVEVDQGDELDVGRDWAFGFFRGVELREIYGRGFGVLTPTYAVVGDWLVIAGHPQPVQGLILRHKGEIAKWKPVIQAAGVYAD